MATILENIKAEVAFVHELLLRFRIEDIDDEDGWVPIHPAARLRHTAPSFTAANRASMR